MSILKCLKRSGGNRKGRMMAREHKYRAWLKQEKKMYEVSVIHFGVQYGMAPSDSANIVLLCDKSQYYREGEEVELLEYIGRKDRKGDEIYSGDIIYRPSINVPMLVRWNEREARFDLTREPENLQSSMLWYTQDCEKDYEILGNVYEHPHLLK
jgi:hypothetical protein